MKLICLNVWNGGVLWDTMVEFLRVENPDILLLQEVHNIQGVAQTPYDQTIESLQKHLDLSHSAFAPAFLNVHAGKKIQKGNAVMSKFPLEQKEVIFFDQPYGEQNDSGEYGQDYTRIPRNLQHVVAVVDSTELNLLNTQGIWGFDGKDNLRRFAMGDTILKAVSGKKHVILAGDLNVNEPSQVIQTLSQRLHNVFAGERTTSFNVPRKKHPGYATAVVDFIFTSSDIQISQHSSPQVDVSDHLPLIIDFTLVS